MGLITDNHLGGFTSGHGGRGTWEPRVWDWAIKQFNVRSMVDVGCGRGHAVAYFAAHGCQAYGVDGSVKALDGSPCANQILIHDYRNGSNPYTDAEEPVDLVWSAEFVEHVEPEYVPNFLPDFATATRAILLQHALIGQGGHHHVNCQPAEYWAEKFSTIGFHLDQQLTTEARKLSRFANRGWGAKGLVFVK